MVNICDMVIVGFVDLEKISGQTNKHTNKQTNKQTNKKKQTNQRRGKDYSRRVTITREPLSKGDSRTGLIAFHIQLPLATLASPIYE